MTVREGLNMVIFKRVALVNGNNIEEALVSMITNTIQKNNNIGHAFENEKLIMVEVPAVEDKEVILESGAYVYCNNSLTNWTFEKFDTIADAVRNAIKMFNAYILFDGKIIEYDALDDKTAYYYENNTMKLVKL